MAKSHLGIKKATSTYSSILQQENSQCSSLASFVQSSNCSNTKPLLNSKFNKPPINGPTIGLIKPKVKSKQKKKSNLALVEEKLPYLIQNRIPKRLKGGGDIQHTTTTESSIEIIQPQNLSPTYRLSLNKALLIANPSKPRNTWSPSIIHQRVANNHPFQLLVQSLQLEPIKLAVHQWPTTTIAKSAATPDIHITTRDMRDLLTYGTPIYHELLVLSLEALCTTYDATYLDPSFYPTLETQGYSSILNRFAPTGHSSVTRPSLDHHSIALPLHINGNHWAALCRRKLHGEMYFLYADDLNIERTEKQVKSALATIPGFMPAHAIWINCNNNTYLPHSNECGPRTILLLAIFLSDPAPSRNMLQHYMNANLAMQARTWMGHLLMTGQSPLLPPNVDTVSLQAKSAPSRPFDLLEWNNNSHSVKLGRNPKQAKALSPAAYNTKEDCNLSNKPSIADRVPSAVSNMPLAQIHINPMNQEELQAQDSNIKSQEFHPDNAKASKIKKRPKQVRPPNQLYLHDFQATFPISQKSQQESQKKDIWGHSLEQIERNSVFRLILQNPKGLKLSGDHINTQYSLSICQTLEAGAVCLPETNTNWGHRQAHSIMQNLLRKTWKHSSYSTSYTMEAFDSINQPGGTLQIITNNWVSRILEKGTDPYGLGRWTYTIMRGAHNRKVVIITAYRVCIQSVTSAGLTTATAQQYRELSKKTREHNIGEDLKPRKQFIMDLQAWIEHLVAAGHGIILSLDANEDTYGMQGSFTPLQYSLARPTVGSGHDSSLATLAWTCGLVDPLLVQHPDSPPPSTYSRGNSRIDYIFLSHSLLPAVLRSGILFEIKSRISRQHHGEDCSFRTLA